MFSAPTGFASLGFLPGLSATTHALAVAGRGARPRPLPYPRHMRVTFLLGSGICVDAAMPSVTEISEQIFSGAGVVRHSDATYYIAGEGAANYDYYRVAAEPA